MEPSRVRGAAILELGWLGFVFMFVLFDRQQVEHSLLFCANAMHARSLASPEKRLRSG